MTKNNIMKKTNAGKAANEKEETSTSNWYPDDQIKKALSNAMSNAIDSGATEIRVKVQRRGLANDLVFWDTIEQSFIVNATKLPKEHLAIEDNGEGFKELDGFQRMEALKKS